MKLTSVLNHGSVTVTRDEAKLNARQLWRQKISCVLYAFHSRQTKPESEIYSSSLNKLLHGVKQSAISIFNRIVVSIPLNAV